MSFFPLPLVLSMLLFHEWMSKKSSITSDNFILDFKPCLNIFGLDDNPCFHYVPRIKKFKEIIGKKHFMTYKSTIIFKVLFSFIESIYLFLGRRETHILFVLYQKLECWQNFYVGGRTIWEATELSRNFSSNKVNEKMYLSLIAVLFPPLWSKYKRITRNVKYYIILKQFPYNKQISRDGPKTQF